MSGAVGRGNTNVWQVRASAETPASGGGGRSPRRVVPPAGTSPLLAPVAPPASAVRADEAQRRADPGDRGSREAPDGKCPVRTGISAGKGGQDKTVDEENCPVWSGVSPPKGRQGGTLFELSAPENLAQNPGENPAANARAGREPQNPRIEDPPTPLGGGSRPRSLIVEQIYVTERGRRRRRLVRVDLDEVCRGLGLPTADDLGDWRRIRELLEATVGESTFAIWLEPAELLAIDGQRQLVVAVPAATALWTVKRFGRLLERCAERVGRELRFATEPEIQALGGAERRVQQPRREAAG